MLDQDPKWGIKVDSGKRRSAIFILYVFTFRSFRDT